MRTSSCSRQTAMMKVQHCASTIQHQHTPQSLPVCTRADDQRVWRDRQCAETVADRLLAAFFAMDSSRGTGRLSVP